MPSVQQSKNAFSNFEVFKGQGNDNDREQLFRNMAHLFSHVSDKCNDDQVKQYDGVLCKLAELVEIEAREHVAELLAPLERAPGNVVVKLANDTLTVARPLLEFSNVLSDDDLIEIVERQSENHRVIIAGRNNVGERVGDAIIENGEKLSLIKLISNDSANIGNSAYDKILKQANDDENLIKTLRNRTGIDWDKVRAEISDAGNSVLEKLSLAQVNTDGNSSLVSEMVQKRIINKAGFNAKEWKISFNQVKALNDRRQLNLNALSRFVRFSYGHHVAAALTIMLRITPEMLVKILASQDYVALTSACKSLGLSDALFEKIIIVLPWRDIPTNHEIDILRTQFDRMSIERAVDIFGLWRSQMISNRNLRPKKV